MRKKQIMMMWLISFVLVVIFSSCGKNQNKENEGQKGFIFKSDSVVAFIQYTNIENQLSGQMQIFSMSNLETNTSNHPFKGLLKNGNISITFSKSTLLDFFGSSIWTGKIEDNSIKFLIPTEDGTLQTLIFKDGNASEYNKAVLDINNYSKNENKKLNQKKAINDAIELVYSDSNSIENRLANLNYETGKIQSLISKEEKQLEEVKEKLNEVYNKKKEVSSSKDPDYAMGNVKYAVGNIEYAVGTMEVKKEDVLIRCDSVFEDNSSIAKLINSLKTDLANYSKLVSNTPEYTPVKALSQSDIDKYIDQVNSNISSSNKISTDGKNKALELLNKAYDYRTEAQNQVKK